MAPSRSPCCASRKPRLLCAVALPGSRSIAAAYDARAPSRSPPRCRQAPSSLVARDSGSTVAAGGVWPVSEKMCVLSIHSLPSRDLLDQSAEQLARIDLRNLELDVAGRDVERLAFLGVDRELHAESQSGSVLERRELPLLAVQLDRREQEIRFDQHESGDVELQLRLDVDARLRREVEPCARRPVDVHAGVERALQ